MMTNACQYLVFFQTPTAGKLQLPTVVLRPLAIASLSRLGRARRQRREQERSRTDDCVSPAQGRCRRACGLVACSAAAPGADPRTGPRRQPRQALLDEREDPGLQRTEHCEHCKRNAHSRRAASSIPGSGHFDQGLSFFSKMKFYSRSESLCFSFHWQEVRSSMDPSRPIRGGPGAMIRALCHGWQPMPL